MTFFAKVNKKSPLYTFWRMNNPRGGMFRGVPFHFNIKTLDFETKELTDLQVKLINQFDSRHNFVIEMVSNSIPAKAVVSEPSVSEPVISEPEPSISESSISEPESKKKISRKKLPD